MIIRIGVFNRKQVFLSDSAVKIINIYISNIINIYFHTYMKSPVESYNFKSGEFFTVLKINRKTLSCFLYRT